MFAVIPCKAKPSKSASTDKSWPILMHAELRETDDGWELVTCDSYQLARVSLRIEELPGDDEPLIAGPISPEALKAIEKSRAFRANGTVEPCDLFGTPIGQSFTRPEVGEFPKWDQITPPAPMAEDEFVIGLDPKKLFELSQSLGATNRLYLRLTVPAYVDSPRSCTKPIQVSADALDYNGVLMPCRVAS